jgi:2-hydroxychromene-2-carboxylate isomerase
LAKAVAYYMSPASPYTYMGGPRLLAIAAETGAEVTIKPIDTGRVMALTGGLPVAKRHPTRLAYRLVELARWRDRLDLPMNIEPAYFPVDAGLASRLIVAARQAGGDAIGLANAILRGVWEQERDIADPETMAGIAQEAGFEAAGLLEAAAGDAVLAEFAANTEAALAAGVFGVPWCVYDGVPYWGQDRLEFLARALAA